MKRLLCAVFGHHNIHCLSLAPGLLPEEFVCIRCYARAPFPPKESPDVPR